jgi:hypothetical protein
MASVYTSEYFASAPAVSVSTFADLPAGGTANQRIGITGESGLFDTTTYPAVVRWSGNVWQLESCAATYVNIGAVEFASGTWTGTGGTVGTKSGATVVDTTYNESWVWNSTSNIFVPNYLNLSTVANQQKIKGDSATPSGWASTLGAGCTQTTDGSKLSFYAQSSSGNTYVSVLAFDDTSRTLTSNFYMKCLIQRNNSTNFEMNTTGQIQMYLQYLSGPSTGRAVEFGDADTAQGPPIGFTGVFYSRFGTPVLYTATANRGDVLTTETLLQFRIVAGTAAQVKVGSGAWHDIAVATCRSGAGTSFTIGTLSSNGTGNKAECKVRYLQAIRYT